MCKSTRMICGFISICVQFSSRCGKILIICLWIWYANVSEFKKKILSLFQHFCLGIDFQESLDKSDQMFKPGWKDIFRMNQNELESEIRKVYRDSTLDPRRKAYLVQNLMTRFVFMITTSDFVALICLSII